ncbi:hypothetical protein H1R20_g14460, partial [Candolleomyces eurysporus]
MFEKAHHFNIEQGTFNAIQGDQLNVQIENTHNSQYNQYVKIEVENLRVQSSNPRSDVIVVKPNATAHFAGRKKELELLNEYFHPWQPTQERCRRVCLLHGLGGIGKTQLALKFVESVSTIYPRGHVFWVDASTSDTIRASLIAIADLPLALESGLDSNTATPQRVLGWIASLKDNWIILFDNANDEINRFFPPGLESGDILITSRDHNSSRGVGKRIEIDVMEEEDAVEMLLTKSEREDNDHSTGIARQIAKELAYLPLALEQAAAAIRWGICDLGSYIELYRKYRQEFLDNPSLQSASDYELTVYGSFEVSWRQMEEKAQRNDSMGVAAQYAIYIFNICTFLHYYGIDEELFRMAAETWLKHLERLQKRGPSKGEKDEGPHLLDIINLPYFEKGWNPVQFRTSMHLWQSVSIIKRDAKSSTYFVHPLIHQWGRDRYPPDQQRQHSRITGALLILAARYNTGVNTRLMHRHAPHFIEHLHLVKDVDTNYWEDRLQLTSKVCEGLQDRPTKAAIDMKIMEERLKHLGERHVLTIRAMSAVVIDYACLNKHIEAKQLLERVLELQRSVLGEDHVETITSMDNLGVLYLQLGNLGEAEPLLMKSLEQRKLIYGEEHRRTFTAISNLSTLYQRLGKFAESEKAGLESFEKRKKFLGDTHPDSLSSMENLSKLFSEEGKYIEAETFERPLLEYHKSIVGQNHFESLASMGRLAQIYNAQGKYIQAEELQMELVSTKEEKFGRNHPETITALADLRTTYQRLGKVTQAKAIEYELSNIKDSASSMSTALVVENVTSVAGTTPVIANESEVRRTLFSDLPQLHPAFLSIPVAVLLAFLIRFFI